MASIQYVVSATDAASSVFAKIGLSADGLDKQLEDLSKRVATPEVDLKDAAFTAGIIRAAERIDKLSEKMATPGANLEDGKFQAEIIKVNAQLDRLDKRHVTATVDVKTDTSRSFLSRIGGIFGGGGGGAAGAAGAAGSAGQGGGLLASGGPIGIGVGISALVGAAASLLPALLPTAIGLLTGGGAAGGALMLGSAAQQKLIKLGSSIPSGTTAADKLKAKQIQAQMAAIRQQNAGPLAAFGAFQGVTGSLKDVFSGAISTAGPGFSAGPGGQQGAPSFLTSLVGIFKQITGFAKTLQPMLADLFRASIPYLQMFVKFMEQAATILLPVFTQSLKQMQPFLPLIGAALLNIVQGLAGMIKAMGPGGMKASAEIFVGLCRAMEFILIGVGHAADWLAKAIMISAHAIVVAWQWLIPAFEDFRHRTAVIFDGVRHDIAHIWDLIYQDTIGAVSRLVGDVTKQDENFRHSTATIFDGIRHDIAHIWDLVFSDTIGKLISGGHAVETRFDDIRRGILAVMNHLPGQLWNLAKTALENVIKGAESVVPHITSFFSGFASGIVGIFKHIWGWFSPSAVMYQGGKALMEGLEKGIKDHAHIAVTAASAAAHQVANVGAGVQRWAPLVKQALAMEGLSSSLLGNVLFQMQTESGGNPNAINLTDSNAAAGDPSRGLMQTIMSTFQAYHWPGTSGNIYDPLANIAAALNYARHVYGPSLMSGGMGIGSGHGYDSGGWLPTGVSLAWNNTGRPERILGPGEGMGSTYNINVHVPPSANKADIGRQVVETIKEFERRSGTGWRN